MFQGILLQADALEFPLATSGSKSGTTSGAHAGQIQSFYAPDALTRERAIYIVSDNGGSSHNVRVDIPIYAIGGPSGYSENFGGSGYLSSQTTLVKVLDYRILADADFLTISWSGVQIFVNGSLVRTLGALSYVTSRFAPDAIWPHGAGVKINASVTLSPEPGGACNFDGTPTGGSNTGPTGNAQGTATGGWRYRIGGTTVAAPVTMGPGLGHASGTTTDSVTSSASFTIGAGSKYGHNSQVEIVPDWPCAVDRMDPDDYEALVLRQASPVRLVRGGVVTIERCKEELFTGSGTTNAPFADVESPPARSAFLDAVTSATSAVEVNLSQSKVCGGESSDFTESFPTATSVGTSHVVTGAGPVAGPLDHYDEWCRLHNTLVAPHWGLTLFYPYESADGDGTPGAGYQWKINGADAGAGEYWFPLRQQHIDHSSLPSEKRSKRRNHVHAEPELQNGYAGRMGSFYGSRAPWWGIPRFDVRVPVRPSSLPFDARSASLYHGDETGDPAPTVSSTAVTIAAGETAIEIELSSWSVWPYQTVKSCDRVTIDWPSGANVSEVRAYLVADDAFVSGETATRTRIVFEKGVAARLANASGKVWWTTAGIDFGAGYVTDIYAAVATTTRDASAVFANVAEREDTPPLAPARSGVRLRIEVVPIDATMPTKIKHPTFLPAPLADARTLHETARHAAFLLKDGPPLRYGHHGYYDYVFDTTVPYGIPENAMAGATTVGDALCFTRAYLEARPPLDALEAELRLIYEWPTEMTMVDHVWRDAYDQIVTHAFALPLVAPGSFGLVSSYRTLPPCGVLPTRKRTKESGWTATGAWGLYSVSHCPTREWLHTPVKIGQETAARPRLIRSGADVLSDPPIDRVPSGHAAGFHRLSVDGAEGYGWTIQLRFGTEWRDLARVRPWRGYGAIWGIGAPSGAFVALSVSRSLAHVLASPAEDGTMTLARANNVTPTDFAYEYPTDFQPDSLRIDHQRGGAGDPVWIAYAKDGVARLARCALGGEPEELTTLGSGTQAALCWSGNNVLHCYRLDGGAVSVRRFDLQGNAIGSEASTGIAGLDDAPIDVDASVLSGALVITLAAVKDGEAVVFRSEGGLTFS